MTSSGGTDGLRISEVVELTGLSKELIHHYLRQGLLPRPETRARYSDQQVRLLHLVRQLREDFHLPLEAIRALFEAFAFDPARVEPMVEIEAVAQRMIRFGEQGDLGLGRTLTADELMADTGIDSDRLAELLELGVIEPLPQETVPRFTVYDAQAVAICEQGVERGVPVDSFRTVSSFVRVAYALAHAEFLRVEGLAERTPQWLAGEIFLRREITAGFVHNVLHSLMQGTLRGGLAVPTGPRSDLDDVVYRPGPAFRQRHGLDEAVTAARQRVADGGDDPAPWRRMAETLLHAGEYREAVFYLEQAMQRWPDEDARGRLGIALVLAGDGERGLELLQEVHDGSAATAEATIYLALARYRRWIDHDPADAVHEGTAVLALIDEALTGAPSGPGSVHVRCFGGWLLTALPRDFQRLDRGRQMLVDLVEELRAGEPGELPLPGLRERYQLNAAWLMFECASRAGGGEGWPASAPSSEALRTRVCRLDPSCHLASLAYLDES